MVLFNRELRYFASTNGDSPMRMLFDGKDVLRFDGASSVILRNLDTQTPDYLFDPRLLGITTSYGWDATIHGSLHLKAPTIELVGREQVNDKAAWRVRMVETNGWDLDIWIDDESGFAVYRIDEKFIGYGRRTTRSFYENQKYLWLPSRIEGEEFNAKGDLLCRRKISILAAEGKVRIPTNTWTLGGLLAGINLPSWVAVTDVRIGQIVGYWNEGRLGPPVPDATRPVPPAASAKRIVVLTVMALFMIAPLVAMWWNRNRKGSSQAAQG